MAKKKNSRQKHQKDTCDDDTSDEELKSYSNGKSCPHIAKAINLARMKKALKSVQTLEKCKDCKDSILEKVPSEAAEIEPDEIWVCLQCGYHGCGRTSSNKHAMAHYRTPRSDCHAMVLSTTSMSIWCYTCDENIFLETSKTLRECVDFVSKFKGKKPVNHIVVNGTGKAPVVNNTSSEPPKVENEKVEKEMSKPVKQKDVSQKTSTVNKKVSVLRTVKGLRNMGNTCFFNAVLQNLCQTPWLKEELERRSEKGFQWEISFPVVENDHLHENPLKVPLFETYPLTQSFLSFLKQMTKPGKTETVHPNGLFDQICKRSPQFRGFHQQDSHELLRHLLDGIRIEEIKRQKKAILKVFNLSEKVNPDEVDDDTKVLLKAYGSVVSHTVIERLFGGQLLSTVVCEECKVSSQVFEPFMDLSLPLTEEKTIRGKVQKHAEDEDSEDVGMFALSKKKDGSSAISKNQEKKLKSQAKKAAKKKGKSVKSAKNNVINEKENEDNASVDSMENEAPVENVSIDSARDEEDGKADGEQSDADVEDNDESENVSLIASTCEGNSSLPDDGLENIDQTCALEERIEELCSQIRDIRIRRDSDKQNDLLDSVEDEKQAATKRQKSGSSAVLDSISDDSENSTWSYSQPEHQVKEWMMRSLTTLKTRYQPSSLECSVNSCLNQFTASELLTGSNKFRCENCTSRKRKVTGDKSAVVYSNASKQMLIFSPPAVLTLHLKRFQQTGMSLRKLNLFVEFPTILDLAPYCSSICLELPHMASVKDEVLYSLYGVVQHSGRLTSGHYVAYVKFHDSSFNLALLNSCPVHQCTLEQLLKKISKVKPANPVPCNISDSTGYKWYYISDNIFKEVSEAEVLRSQAYILFYQRVK